MKQLTRVRKGSGAGRLRHRVGVGRRSIDPAVAAELAVIVDVRSST